MDFLWIILWTIGTMNKSQQLHWCRSVFLTDAVAPVRSILKGQADAKVPFSDCGCTKIYNKNREIFPIKNISWIQRKNAEDRQKSGTLKL